MQNIKPNKLHHITTNEENLISRMSLAEKIGQMTQVEKNSITPAQVAEFSIGSVLSGGGGNPDENSPGAWLEMVNSFLGAAAQMRLPIPLLYGVDAVHGHSNVYGATIFPHNIGLGATRDPDLVGRIGRATAVEAAATGVRWDFAPSVSVAKDLRWGRTFESYSEDTELVSALGVAYIAGLLGDDLAGSTSVLPSVKHYVADGGTRWGTPEAGYAWIPGYWEQTESQFMVDQGVAEFNEARLRREHLPPYMAAIEAGAQNIMVSYSSWGGMKMHTQKYLLTDLLKHELGFEGFLVSDWLAIDQISPDYYTCVVESINAGLDMIMVPFDFRRFINTLAAAVEQGAVSEARIDDAVQRILQVKAQMGLFDAPLQDESLLSLVGCDDHRRLAREAVQKSAVLLKNAGKLLPLTTETNTLFVAGQAADDIGLCCGGWTINWMGGEGAITLGATILEGLHRAAPETTTITYAPAGGFDQPYQGDVGIVVLHEDLYVEGYGDRADLSLPDADVALLERVAAQCKQTIVILVSGRPLIIRDHLDKADAWIAAWLPGSESDGVGELLFGQAPFGGKLPFTWPLTTAHVPAAGKRGAGIQFSFGHGLSTDS